MWSKVLMDERGWQRQSQPRKPARPRSGRTWGGVAAVCVSVGGILFALVAWQLLRCWGISLSCWQGLSGPVREVEAIGSLRHDHIPSSRPAGTLGPRARLGVVGRTGRGCGWHRAHLEGLRQGPGVGLWGRLRGRRPPGGSQEDPQVVSFTFLAGWVLRYMPLASP